MALDPAHLAAFDHVRGCLTWQLRSPAAINGEDPASLKAVWLREVSEQWGTCGQVVLREGSPAALAIYAPQAWLPGAARLPTAPASPDAVVLASVYVAPEHRGGGLSRLLVQAMARDLVQRADRPAAVEVFAGVGECRQPVDYWTRLGFGVERPHAWSPRLRMELRDTVRVRAGAAIGRLAGAVRPRPVVAPQPPLGRGSGQLRRAGRTAR